MLLVNQGVSSIAKIIITNVLCINVCRVGPTVEHLISTFDPKPDVDKTLSTGTVTSDHTVVAFTHHV